MDGFQKPTRWPTAWSITAAAPFSCGATKLVPPQPDSSGSPVNPVKYSSYPVNGSASAETSGTARPKPVPVLTGGWAWKVHAVGSAALPNGFGSTGVRYFASLN